MVAIIAGVVIGVLVFAIIAIIAALYFRGYVGTRYQHKRQPSDCHESQSSRVPMIYHQDDQSSRKNSEKSQQLSNSEQRNGSERKHKPKPEQKSERRVAEKKRSEHSVENVYAVPSVTTASTQRSAPSTQRATSTERTSSSERSASHRQSGRSTRSGKVVYAEVGGDGGRKGPKPRVVKSEYAKVHMEADVTLDKYSVRVHEDGDTTSGEEEDPMDHNPSASFV